MDQIYRRPRLRVLNQKEDRALQQRLNLLERQYRYTRKMLQQRRDSLINQQRKVVMVKVCEPKATVNIAMKEIRELRGVRTSDGGGRASSNKGSDRVEQSRSISAPPPTGEPTGVVRHRGNILSSVSLMQMKNIATIDSISEKELAKQQQKAREEVERMRWLQRETLHKKVTTFIESLRDKGNVEIFVEEHGSF